MVWCGTMRVVVLYVSWPVLWLGYVRFRPISLGQNRFKCPGLVWPPLALSNVREVYLTGLGIMQEIQRPGYPDESTETQILDLPPHIISDITVLRAVPPPQLWTPAGTTSFLPVTPSYENTNITAQNTPTDWPLPPSETDLNKFKLLLL